MSHFSKICDVDCYFIMCRTCCFLIVCLSASGCAMSGLIADAKTLIDKARVETQVWMLSKLHWKQFTDRVSWPCAVNLCTYSSTEPLVHLQWDDDSGECDSGCVQPGATVWRGGRWSRCHGQSLSSSVPKHSNANPSDFVSCHIVQ